MTSKGSDWQDVEILTSYVDYVGKVFTTSAKQLIAEGIEVIPSNVIARAEDVMHDVDVHVQERVEVGPRGVTIYVNAKKIDDAAVEKAWEMLSSALDDVRLGDEGVVTFGPPMMFFIDDDLRVDNELHLAALHGIH